MCVIHFVRSSSQSVCEVLQRVQGYSKNNGKVLSLMSHFREITVARKAPYLRDSSSLVVLSRVAYVSPVLRSFSTDRQVRARNACMLNRVYSVDIPIQTRTGEETATTTGLNN